MQTVNEMQQNGKISTASDILLTGTPAKQDDIKDHRPDADEIYDVAAASYEFIKDATTGDLYAVDIETRLAEPLAPRGAFRNRVVRLAQNWAGKVPKSQSVSEALEAMMGEAMDESTAIRPVHLRLAQMKTGKVWIDLLDTDNRVILIADGEWEIKDRTAFGIPIFRRSPAMKPLPLPEHVENWKQGLAKLWTIINVPEEHRPLLIGWVIHCILHEHATYPILLLQAEQGSGKTWTMRVLCSLIDPSRDTGGALPANENDFAIAALNSWLLPFDNISTIPPSKRDLLCKTATGGAVRRRKLYTDATEGIYDIRRPIAITGINVGTTAPDLAERILRIELHRPADSDRVSIAELSARWERDRGEIYGAVLTLAAKIDKKITEGIEVDKLPRMADFGLTLAALDAITGSHTLDSYREQQTSLAIETVSDEPVFLALEANRSLFTATVDGVTSGDLLRQLQPTFDGDVLDTWKNAPKSAADLTRAMDICAPSLRQRGWAISSRKGTGRNSGSRIWTIKAPAATE